jgi:ferrous iron transport protein B
MKRVILMGNPNVGKSVIFSRLTGSDAISSNYPGTTVDILRGKMQAGGEGYEIIDAPGTYSLEASNPAEEIAARLAGEGDLIIQVIDATTLERNLLLTLELLAMEKPLLIALNLWDEAMHTGIRIDVDRLRDLLGVPVIPTVALSGEGIRDLVRLVPDARAPPVMPVLTEGEKWVRIGSLVREVQEVTHRHHTFRDRVSDLTIHPLTGLPIGLLILLLCVGAVWLIGEGIHSLLMDPLFELYRSPVTSLALFLGAGLPRDVLIGHLFAGEISYSESMGILTTGLYVPFGIVLPYILAFYAALAVLEDSGYLPRFATLVDSLFHRLGMHGHAIVPCLLGLGCNVPGVLATRILETRKQRFIAATLLAVSIPCMAQSAMIFGVLGPYGARYIILVYGTLLLVYVGGGLLLNRLIPGESPEILLEIPPYRAPHPAIILRKTWMRVKGFLFEAIPFLFLGVLIVNILFFTGAMDLLGVISEPLMSGWFGLPGTATAALLMGFLRKDLAVGMLIPLGMTAGQMAVSVTVLTITFPCAATFAVLFRELGFRNMIGASAVMVGTACVIGGVMRVLLIR